MIKSIKSLSLLSVGSFVSSGSAFLIYTILAREIGPESFGVFSSSMAIMKMFLLIGGFGVPQLWLKVFGKEGWEAIRWIRPSIKFVLLSFVLILISILILVFFIPNDGSTKFLLLILFLFILGNVSVQLVSSKLQLEERYGVLALWQLTPNLLRLLIVVLIFYVFDLSLKEKGVGVVYGVIGLVFVILASKELILMLQGNFLLKGHSEQKKDKTLQSLSLKKVLYEAWPFGAATLFAFIYMQSDIIMVKYMMGNEAAGYYNISFVVLSALLLIPTILFSKFLLPKYHRWANKDRGKLYRTYKKGNLIMIVTGSCCMLIIFLLSPFFIPLIFGEEYLPAVNLFKILSISLPISFLSYSIGATLVTNEHMKLKVKLMGSVALFNIVCNLFIIPKYGAIGAAISTVVSNMLLLILYYYNAQKRVFKKGSSEYNFKKS
ncbi:MAG: oligosaccharide flippase family protein [Galbibacter orientalis]|uniref:oligosaccharide flippase family protein n=1 Tax=Galbibacter orientalis TaxID=453852 RepID=UPI0030025B00